MGYSEYASQMDSLERFLRSEAPLPEWRVVRPRDFTSIEKFNEVTDRGEMFYVSCYFHIMVSGSRILRKLIVQRCYGTRWLNNPGMERLVRNYIIPDAQMAMAKKLFGSIEE